MENKTKGKIRKSIRKDIFGHELMAKWQTNSHTVNIYMKNIQGMLSKNVYKWKEITVFSIGDFSKNSANVEDWKKFLKTTWSEIIQGKLEI